MTKYSDKLTQRACNVMPRCIQTTGKEPAQYGREYGPSYIQRAEGCHVWDTEGNEYIEYTMGLGPVVLGHNYPAVTESVIEQVRKGTLFPLSNQTLVEVCELITELVPTAEMVRVAKNGSDVTGAAVRAARAYTGREIIAHYGYHGWHDWYVASTPANKGIPGAIQNLTLSFNYNNIESLKRIFEDHPGEVAAVIMEPVAIEEPVDDFLKKVQDLARSEGALLIFDEVFTGFRVANGGAQDLYDIQPDLSCFAKAMGNGYPISAVAGPRDIMKIFNEIFFELTYADEAVSLAACKATLNEIKSQPVIDHLWTQGQKIKDGVNSLALKHGIEDSLACKGLPPRTSIDFKLNGNRSQRMRQMFKDECARRGILFAGRHNLSYSHSDSDIERTLEVYDEVIGLLPQLMDKAA